MYQREWAEELGGGEDSGGEGKGIEELRSYNTHESIPLHTIKYSKAKSNSNGQVCYSETTTACHEVGT